MRVALITYNHYFDRVLAVRDYFESKSNETKVFVADYVHKKGYISDSDKRDDVNYVHADSYEKNLSYKRIKSYINWSKKILAEVSNYRADLVYFLIPPNSLLRQLVKYKKANPQIKLMLDIFDLWPESLPISNGKKKLVKPLLSVWRGYRNKNLKYADCIFTECDYYKEILGKQGIDTKDFVTLHLYGDAPLDDVQYVPSETLRFLYLGSINNIIDIDKIVALLAEVSKTKKVVLNIIGSGEQKDRFINEANVHNIKTVYHGEVYNDEFKQKIMNECDFGINVYKENLAIGLTIKSVDYFRSGLPIINTIMGDTHKLVESENIGVNLCDIANAAKTLSDLSQDDILQMRSNTCKCYNNYFTKDIFCAKIDKIFGSI